MPQLKPNDVVIVDCARSAITPPKQGDFQHVHPEQLCARLIFALLQRQPFDQHDIDAFMLGCSYQEQQQSQNIARRIALLAQLPAYIHAHSINALTGSSMQALHHACAHIMAAQAHVVVLAGLEHITPVPSSLIQSCKESSKYYPAMLQHTAYGHDLLASMYDISRADQDQMALASHQKAQLAQQKGLLKTQMIALEGQLSDGQAILSTEDRLIQTDISLTDLQQQPTISLLPQATLTTSNSAMPASAASCMLVMSHHYAQQCGLKARAVIRTTGVAGCDPAIAPFALVPATQKALKRVNMTVQDIQQFEIHEASASQYLTALKALELLPQQDQINQYGGAIALGDASGATGLQLLTSLLHRMEQQDSQFGLASLSMPLGQGMCTIIERI
ncbi:acetyl-CoA C-acyltransferase [Acinetobacter sp. B5B]|uniref:acetyl-CoA C-acyltransferase n=1 Tax=Acinetobacter baretiae TaxID=2605383 RepID=UPI0018C2A0B9|nr:acetyl-CoA C-acyltransferase [Acinetobacter baretiae]MBF7682784.1 acetyl-CoA C-acyltransferase [Acinetobacter baretiae]